MERREGCGRRGVLWAGAAALLAAGCRRPEASAAAREPRLVSVGGAVTEVIFALGAGGQVVGVDTSSVFPAGVTGLPRVGYQRQLSAEGVLALRPTRVLGSQDAGPAAALEQIRAAGVEVLVVQAEASIDGARGKVRRIGGWLGREREAEEVVARIDREVAASAALPRRKEKPRVLAVFARGAGAVMASGKGSAAAAMIELVGAESAAAGVEGTRPLSAESAIAARPDVILTTTHGVDGLGGVDGLLKAPGIAETPAGKAGRVVVLDDLLLLGFGPRVGEAAAQLSRAIHGDG